jgi:phosphatidylinositol alpha-1,6-mannosyltransferase
VLTPREDRRGRFEGLGLVYLEAGARGKAVLGSAGCGAEDAIEPDRTGLLVPPEDLEATTGQLRRLLADLDLRARLGQAGRSRAEGLTWEGVALAVREVCREAVRR